jgi:ABC-type transporter Mla subunit MlaD
MLSAYKSLQANGAIGPMMKINAAGEPIFDPSGQVPGNLVVRPFQEYPKAVKRWKDAEGNTKELIAHSKQEELKIISERIDEFSGDDRSPVEKERDQLASEVSAQRDINNELEKRLQDLAARVEQLTKVQETPSVRLAAKAATGTMPAATNGLSALSAEKKAVLNQK